MLVIQLPCTGDLEMVERSEFHFNESYLVARAEINQTSVKKKKKEGMLAIWTQVCPMEHNGRHYP